MVKLDRANLPKDNVTYGGAADQPGMSWEAFVLWEQNLHSFTGKPILPVSGRPSTRGKIYIQPGMRLVVVLGKPIAKI